MHPKEWRRERCGTGRLTCLNLADAEILSGVNFDKDPRLLALLADPGNYPILLYPGEGALNLSEPEAARSLAGLAGSRRIVALLVDATWSCSKAVLRESSVLQGIPRVMFTPRQASRWLIKKQPGPLCLSTLETVHELLCTLEAAGLEEYADKERLLDVFMRMQRFQVECGEARHAVRRSRDAAIDESPVF